MPRPERGHDVALDTVHSPVRTVYQRQDQIPIGAHIALPDVPRPSAGLVTAIEQVTPPDPDYPATWLWVRTVDDLDDHAQEPAGVHAGELDPHHYRVIGADHRQLRARLDGEPTN